MKGSFRTTDAIRRELVKSGRATLADINEWEHNGDISAAEAEQFRSLPLATAVS